MLQLNDEFSIKVISFDTARSLVSSQDVFYLASDFVDKVLRDKQNFNKKYDLLAERASEAISIQFGKKQSANYRMDITTITQAVWFLYWTELCNIIPIRSALKNSKNLLKKKIVLVPTHSDEINIFQGWKAYSDVVPLITYLQLKKLGIDAYLVMPPERPTSEISIKIDSSIINTQILSKGRTLFCTRGIRGTRQAVKHAFADFASPHAIKNLRLSMENFPKQKTVIKLRPTSQRKGQLEFISYNSTFPCSYYDELIKCDLLKKIELVYKTIHQLAEKQSINEAHICDHLFVDTAVIAGCIRSRGGKVILWPHSSSMPLTNHYKAPPYKITRILKDCEADSLFFSSTKFSVRSELMLTAPKHIHSVVRGEKQNIILIAGVSKINQMPVINVFQHESTIRAFIAGLADRENILNVFIRSKEQWADLKYFESLSNRSLKEAPGTPSEIDLPNMTFVCIGHCSSALIEGVGRGIPSLVISETPVRDYLNLDQKFFPRLRVEKALKIIDAFQDQNYYENYWEKQSMWFEKYCSFN